MLNMKFVWCQNEWYHRNNFHRNWTCSNPEAFDEVEWSRGASAPQLLCSRKTITCTQPAEACTWHRSWRFTHLYGYMEHFHTCEQCYQENCHVYWLAGEHLGIRVYWRTVWWRWCKPTTAHRYVPGDAASISPKFKVSWNVRKNPKHQISTKSLFLSPHLAMSPFISSLWPPIETASDFQKGPPFLHFLDSWTKFRGVWFTLVNSRIHRSIHVADRWG